MGGFDQEEINDFYARYDDLSDLEVPFDEDVCKSQFNNAKKYLLELEGNGSIVTKYANDFTNLYSLWAIVCLNNDKLPNPSGFAARYSAFMEEVGKYKNAEYYASVINSSMTSFISATTKYYQNSTGASTEPPQREGRHEALVSAIFQ